MDAVVAGRHRLTPQEALDLYRHADLTDLGRWSSAVAQRLHGPTHRTYVIDRNINYTNVCSAHCTFCAFKRDPGEEGQYTLSTRELHTKIRELVTIGGTQILLQGGMHPDLPITFYEEMLRGIKKEFPGVHVHGFSPPEFVEFVAVFEMGGFPTTAPGQSHTLPWNVWCAKLEAIMRRLMAAGLDSLPGGGGEIFAPHVRRRIGPGKCSADQWLEVMATAHRLGMFTSATMMFGHIEGLADRIDHLSRVRQAQDRAISGGWPGRYVSFIAWPFQRENTPLGRLKEWDIEATEPFPGDVLALTSRDREAAVRPQGHPPEKGTPGTGQAPNRSYEGDRGSAEAGLAGKRLRLAGSTDYLRLQAIARLFLDNVPSIGASWVTMGPKIGQMGLFFGANDLGSVMMEENVVSAAGTTYCLDEAVLCHLIRSAGFTPAQRDNRYHLLKIHTGPESPDLAVRDWSQHRMGRLHVEGKPTPLTVAAGNVDGGSAAGFTDELPSGRSA